MRLTRIKIVIDVPEDAGNLKSTLDSLGYKLDRKILDKDFSPLRFEQGTIDVSASLDHGKVATR